MKDLLKLILFIIIFVSCSDDPVKPPVDNDNDEIYSVESQEEISDTQEWEFHPAWSNDGLKVAFAKYHPSTKNLGLWIWEKESGNSYSVITGLKGDIAPSWNNNDTKIAIDIRDSKDISQIYIIDLTTRALEKFTDGNSNSFRPTWSKDGNKIAYIYNNSIFIKLSSGGNAQKVSNTTGAWNPVWNKNGTKLLYSTFGNNSAIYTINEDGSEKKKIVSTETSGEIWAKWSPDNSHIIYDKENGNISNLVIRDLVSNFETQITTLNDCRFVDWSPNEFDIIMVQGDNLWKIVLEKK